MIVLLRPLGLPNRPGLRVRVGGVYQNQLAWVLVCAGVGGQGAGGGGGGGGRPRRGAPGEKGGTGETRRRRPGCKGQDLLVTFGATAKSDPP